MKETKEELLKRTRGELEEIAEKLGISTIGIPRTRIAKSIFEARKKSGVKEIPKKKAKLQTVKKGVFAKRAAVDDQIKVNENFAAKMGVGVKDMHKGIKEIQKDIGAQIKVNENFAAKMGLGVKEVHRGIKELKSAIDEETIEMQKGIKEIHNGIEAMGADFRKFQHETVVNYIKDFYYG